MTDTEKAPLIQFYERRFYCFSNYSAFAVECFGYTYMTAEHAYQASKFKQYEIIREIRNALSPHDAKQIARQYSEYKRNGWEKSKVPVMEAILRAKVAQHPYVKEMLLKSGDRYIVEDSPYDSFWGWGPNKDGQNNLGKLWMKIRDDLKNET